MQLKLIRKLANILLVTTSIFFSSNTYASHCSAHCKQFNEDKQSCLDAAQEIFSETDENGNEQSYSCRPCKWAMMKKTWGIGKTNRCYDNGQALNVSDQSNTREQEDTNQNPESDAPSDFSNTPLSESIALESPEPLTSSYSHNDESVDSNNNSDNY